jgi:hypothetical protein
MVRVGHLGTLDILACDSIDQLHSTFTHPVSLLGIRHMQRRSLVGVVLVVACLV